MHTWGDIVFDKCNLFNLQLAETQAHGGRGLILFNRILSGQMINGACNFMDFTCMPPGTSVGMHSHAADQEEYYLILRGTGHLQRDGKEFRVQAGDLVRNPPGGCHALENIGSEELCMFVFELRVLGHSREH